MQIYLLCRKNQKDYKNMFSKFLYSEEEINKKWRCHKYGYIHNGSKTPKRCPICEQYRVGETN